MVAKVLLLAALAVMAAADQAPTYTPPRPTYSAPTPSYGPAEPTGPAQYNFNWAVKDDYSGNDFGQDESRDGYNTQGSYYVLLPDGRLQRVNYRVEGDSGFLAEVSYEGEAQYPEQQSYRPQPTYQQPQPTYQQPQPTYQ
ncbi:cuticle protein 18.6-like [Portunus trituberculatus]|uniref:cuticle protein 18.6-like n=1 Tax=Portunus trituberculatus TaxID=210409 RepID=UPI001E1CC1E5|nr:cuticle protein 18.6-like [Portunus trituberculatus]